MGRGDGYDRNLCLAVQTRALHPAALDHAVFFAASLRLELWIVENDSGCAGVFRIRNLRVVARNRRAARGRYLRVGNSQILRRNNLFQNRSPAERGW